MLRFFYVCSIEKEEQEEDDDEASFFLFFSKYTCNERLDRREKEVINTTSSTITHRHFTVPFSFFLYVCVYIHIMIVCLFNTPYVFLITTYKISIDFIKYFGRINEFLFFQSLHLSSTVLYSTSKHKHFQ